jgi:hypothetical protein
MASTSAPRFGSVCAGSPGINARTTCSGVSVDAKPARLPPDAPRPAVEAADGADVTRVDAGGDGTVDEHDATSSNGAHAAIRLDHYSFHPQAIKCIRTCFGEPPWLQRACCRAAIELRLNTLSKPR